MITFHFTGEPFPSLQKQQEDKKIFLEKLGPFEEEFSAKNGIVTFNHSYPPESKNYISFVLGDNPHELGDFIRRWNDYIVSTYGDTSELS